MTQRYDGAVAVVTGGAQGIGAALAERLASAGARVVVADVRDAAGADVAAAVGGTYVHCDVRDPDEVQRLLATAAETHGRVDLVFPNAGVRGDSPLGEAFDLAAYRRAMAVNVDGVVFTVQAALPHLVRAGGGRVVVTASMAGLVPTPIDVAYGATKSAVVGFVRSAAPLLAAQGVTLAAVCPSFADTAILGDSRGMLEGAGFSIMPVSQVVDAFVAVLEHGAPGECWMAQAGRDPEPFRFRNAPGPRHEDGSRMSLDQDAMRPEAWR